MLPLFSGSARDAGTFGLQLFAAHQAALCVILLKRRLDLAAQPFRGRLEASLVLARLDQIVEDRNCLYRSSSVVTSFMFEFRSNTFRFRSKNPGPRASQLERRTV